MIKTITRIVKGIGSLLPRGQGGAVDSAILYSLLLTLLALSNNGFDIKNYPELGDKLQTKCSNMDQLTDPSAKPADVKACADTMIQVAATGLADINPVNLMCGLYILGAVDAGFEAMSWNNYTIGITAVPASPLPNATQTVNIHITKRDPSGSEYSASSADVSVSVTGSNGYTNNFSKKTDYAGNLSFDIPGASGGTIFTITVTAWPGSVQVVTKTFTTTVSYPTYSGTFQVQGVEKHFTTWHDTAYTCSCTLTRKGTATVTIEPFTTSANKPYIGHVKYTNITSTLSGCSTTPPVSPDGVNVDMCYPHHSGESWIDTSIASIPGVWTIPTTVTWSYNGYGGPCSPITIFSGTVTDTMISGTVSLTPDPTDKFCSMAIQSVNNQFFTWPLNK